MSRTSMAHLMDGLREFYRARRPVLTQHAWVALALTAIALAGFVSVRYGNSWGYDDWTHTYDSCQRHNPEIVERPLALFIVYATCPIFGTAPYLYHLTLLGIRAICGFLLYLLIWQVAPTQPLFAFACGAASEMLLVKDSFFLLTLLQQTDHILGLVLTLLALNAFVAFLQSQGNVRWLWLIASLILAGVAPLVRESNLPLLFGIPVCVMIARRARSRSQLAGLAAWILVIILDGIRFLNVIRQPGNYSAGTFQDLNLTRMAVDSLRRLEIILRPMGEVLTNDLYHYRATIIIAVGVSAISFWIIHRIVGVKIVDSSIAQPGRRWVVWLMVGVLATGLGYAAFLPTLIDAAQGRSYYLSIGGIAIVLVSAIWWLSELRPNLIWRVAVQLGGLALIAALGSLYAGFEQDELTHYAATWDNAAVFFRSLATLAPDVKDPTLFVYIENRRLEPMGAGSYLQYGLRYFYHDHATGIVPSNTVYGIWQVSDAGIWFQEMWIDTPHLFGWDNIIFITRDDSGRVQLLERLPDPFLTAYRQSRYNPAQRILRGFIPARIQGTFPILSGTDWAGENYLLLKK